MHAGEAAGADSIADAVHGCHAHRIGHGTRLYEDPVLRDYIRDHRIALETNITSNVQTRAVPSASAHPVRAYYDAGLNVTLSTDNWLMSGVTLSGEYWLAHTELGFTRAGDRPDDRERVRERLLPWPERRSLADEARDELASL